MKVVARPIDVIACFALDGAPTPLRFKYDDRVIKIDRVISKQLEKLAGNNMFVFTCQSCISGQERVYEIKYELRSCKWMLFKI